jgi:uncharacterized membrane-anchored protein
VKVVYKNETKALVNIRGKKLKPGETVTSQVFIKHFEEYVENGSLTVYVDGEKVEFGKPAVIEKIETEKVVEQPVPAESNEPEKNAETTAPKEAEKPSAEQTETPPSDPAAETVSAEEQAPVADNTASTTEAGKKKPGKK